MVVQKVTTGNYDKFIQGKPFAVLHCSATWNQFYDDQIRNVMNATAKKLGNEINFGEMDIDDNAEISTELQTQQHLMNVPVLIYYQNGQIIKSVGGLITNIQLEQKIKELFYQAKES
jgi:thioredoxin-like negative regulator of GroEL